MGLSSIRPLNLEPLKVMLAERLDEARRKTVLFDRVHMVLHKWEGKVINKRVWDAIKAVLPGHVVIPSKSFNQFQVYPEGHYDQRVTVYLGEGQYRVSVDAFLKNNNHLINESQVVLQLSNMTVNDLSALVDQWNTALDLLKSISAEAEGLPWPLYAWFDLSVRGYLGDS